ncbi:MAG: flagellar hook-basal body complex protein [Pseudomonadota bacterium]
MGLGSSLNAGVAGLSVNATKLATISDNIANSETFGYKRARAEFTSLVLEQSTGRYNAGGVRSATFRDVSAQGALIGTTNSTDISVSGSGLLPVTTIQGINSTAGDRPFLLTSTGSFAPDENGLLRTLSGLYLMGWPANPDGTVTVPGRDSATGLEPVDITRNQFASAPTRRVELGVNIPASETAPGITGQTFDLPIEYFDNLGTSQTLTIRFTPTNTGTTASNTWTLEVFDRASATPDTAIGNLTVLFDDSQAAGGSIATVTSNTPGVTYDDTTGDISLEVVSGPLTLNIGAPGDGGPLTQLAATYSPTNVEKDGAPIGSFSRVEIDENGNLEAFFDNGFSRTIYQIPIGSVPNPDGLTPVDNQAFSLSQSSGGIFFFDAGTGPVGTTVGFALTESTTEIAEELTDLIQTQRAYSSNATVVRTVDEMLQETTNIKR